MTIGENIRAIRKSKNMTLKEVADQTNLSIPFLSQLETNKCNATMATLRLISDVLGIHPSYFFHEAQEHLHLEKNNTHNTFSYENLSGDIHANFLPQRVRIKPGDTQFNNVQHSGHEFVYCLKGIVTLTIGDKRIDLTEGTSYMYQASEPHYWYNYTDEEVEFLVVNDNV